MPKRKVWSHPKFKKNKFIGSYHLIELAKLDIIERIFMLKSIPTVKNNSFKKISYESWQAAVAAGWSCK